MGNRTACDGLCHFQKETVVRYILYMGLFLLVGCQEDIKIPDPAQITREAEGHYCNMIVIDHPGPKAHIFEKGQGQAIWFTSVRDALAYKILPGEAQQILAIYVHDMGRATSWDKPQDQGIWIKAEQAIYVINSRKRGGMGAKETIPFGTREKADQFVHEFGGLVVLYTDIPPDYILGDSDEYDHAT